MRVPESMEIEVSDGKPVVEKLNGGGYAISDEDGVTISMSESLEDLDDDGEMLEDDWWRNLVDDIQSIEEVLEDLSSKIRADKESRDSWEQRAAAGISLLGLDPVANRAAIAENGAKVIHPMLNEACIQFAARAKAEIFPPNGPCRTRIFGDNTSELLKQARRQREYMNYQYTVVQPEAVNEVDRMLYRIALEGSGFKKIYFDQLFGRPKTTFISADKLLVNDESSCLENADRITHIMTMSKSDIKRLQDSGYFKSCDISLIQGDDNHFNEIDQKISEVEGRQVNAGVNGDDIEDDYHTIYECHCKYELKDDKACWKKGVCLPYIITIDIDADKILRVTRNWEEDDKYFIPVPYFTHYKFLEGLGFYGLGFIHLIGDLCQTATDSIRALLDAAYFSNMQGGFIDKKAKINQIDAGPMVRGQWYQVQYGGQDLKQAIVPMDYPEPSPTMLKLLEIIVDYGHRTASTTETMVGDASNAGPVGTTLALIEQGSKVYSDAHRRLHDALGKELKIMERVIIENLDEDDKYPYTIDASKCYCIVDDFKSDNVSIIPVSDPKIFSQTQRITKMQTIMGLANSAPTLYNMREVHRCMLEAIEFDDLDSIMVNEKDFQFLDPVSENVALTSGRPIKAYMMQDHAAHLMVHQQYIQGLDQTVSKIIMPAMIAHIAEHSAYKYQVDMLKGGVPVPEGNVSDKRLPYLPQGMNDVAEAQISQMSAVVAQKMQQVQMQMAQQARQQQMAAEMQNNKEIALVKVSGEIEALKAKTQAEIQMEAAKTQATIQQKGIKAATDIQFRDRKDKAAIARDDDKHVASLVRKDQENAVNLSLQDKSNAAKIERDNLNMVNDSLNKAGAGNEGK